jgi:hypothetical protein
MEHGFLLTQWRSQGGNGLRGLYPPMGRVYMYRVSMYQTSILLFLFMYFKPLVLTKFLRLMNNMWGGGLRVNSHILSYLTHTKK